MSIKTKKGYKIQEEQKLSATKKLVRLFLPKSSFIKFESKVNFAIAFTHDLIGLAYNSIFLYGLYILLF